MEPEGMHDATSAQPEAMRGRPATSYRRREGPVPAAEQGGEPQQAHQLRYAEDCPGLCKWVEQLQIYVFSAEGTANGVADRLVSTFHDPHGLGCRPRLLLPHWRASAQMVANGVREPWSSRGTMWLLTTVLNWLAC